MSSRAASDGRRDAWVTGDWMKVARRPLSAAASVCAMGAADGDIGVCDRRIAAWCRRTASDAAVVAIGCRIYERAMLEVPAVGRRISRLGPGTRFNSRRCTCTLIVMHTLNGVQDPSPPFVGVPWRGSLLSARSARSIEDMFQLVVRDRDVCVSGCQEGVEVWVFTRDRR